MINRIEEKRKNGYRSVSGSRREDLIESRTANVWVDMWRRETWEILAWLKKVWFQSLTKDVKSLKSGVCVHV